MADDRFYVKTLTLENFRCFEKAELGPFDPHFNLLVGENGAGKSSVLVALAELFRQFGAPELNGPGKSLIGRSDARLEHRLGLDGVTGLRLHLDGVVRATFEWEGKSWAASEYVSDPNPLAAQNPREVVNSLTGATDFRPGMNMRAEIADAPLALIVQYSTLRNFGEFSQHLADSTGNPLLRLEGLANWKNAGISSSALREWVKEQTGAESQRLLRAIANGASAGDAARFNQLRAVVTAVTQAVEEASSFEYEYDRQDIVVQWKSGARADFSTQSDGQRMMIGLIADIARRVCQLNAAFLGANCLEKTPGLVLIDEIDLHLHPKWQRQIVPALKKVFPKIQFFATTHSPQVIGSAQPEEIVVLTPEGQKRPGPSGSFGRDSNWVLECVMGAEGRDPGVAKQLKQIWDTIEEGRFDDARALMAKLRSDIGDDPDLIGAESYIWRMEHVGDDEAAAE